MHSGLFPRTTWEDSSVFGLPHATKVQCRYMMHRLMLRGNTDGTFHIYFEHETGVNQQEAASNAVATSIPARYYIW